jgi:hypothetical protein
MLSEQMARYYLDCARRRTASSPHPCKVSVSQQHGVDSLPGRLMFWPVSRAYLSRKLTRPLPTKDGGTLRTVLDARAYMLRLSKDRERSARWQRAAQLLLAKADVALSAGNSNSRCSMTASSMLLTEKPNQPEENGECGTECADLPSSGPGHLERGRPRPPCERRGRQLKDALPPSNDQYRGRDHNPGNQRG